MYVICDIDEINESGRRDNVVTYFGYTESLYLLQQFVHSMENLMYAYVVDEITIRKRDNFYKQIEKWFEMMEISNKRLNGDSASGFNIDHCFDKDYDQICIFSSRDETMHVALTSGIVCDYIESLYGNFEILYYQESDLQHVTLLVRVFLTLRSFLRDESLLSMIKDVIKILLYVYTPNQLMMNDLLDDVKYLVYFCGINPII